MLPFPDWLVGRMKSEGHTALSLAAEVGVTEQAVSDWVHAKYLPSSPKLPLLARALNGDASDIRRMIAQTRNRAATCQEATAAPVREVSP